MQTLGPKSVKKRPVWLWLCLITAGLWGVWGALIEVPEKHFQPGFPATLSYIVWSLTMLPCAWIALHRSGWRMRSNLRAVAFGLSGGLCGSIGQLALFLALRSGPAFLIFPIITLSPVLTVILSLVLLRERTNRPAAFGILLSLLAIPLLAIQPPESGVVTHGYAWLMGTLVTFIAWGVQGLICKASTDALDSEGLFVYMALGAVALAPVAWLITDHHIPVNWGITGPALTAAIQLLNSLGAPSD